MEAIKIKASIPFREIANQTGLHISTVKQAFSKDGNPTILTANKISTALNISVYKLFFTHGKTPREVLEEHFEVLQSEEVVA